MRKYYFFSSLTTAIRINFKPTNPSCFPSPEKGLIEIYLTALEKKTHAFRMTLCWSGGPANAEPHQLPVLISYQSETCQLVSIRVRFWKLFWMRVVTIPNFLFFQRSDKLVGSQQAIPWHSFQREGQFFVLWSEKYFLVTQITAVIYTIFWCETGKERQKRVKWGKEPWYIKRLNDISVFSYM